MMKYLKFLFLIFSLWILASCTCGENDPKGNIRSKAQLMSLTADTVYIVHHQDNFKKLEFKQKAHPQIDSIRRINFYLKRKDGQKDTFFQYIEKDIEFTNDSVYVKPTNNLYMIKKELIKNDQVIAPSLLMSMSNREIFFMLEEKKVVFLENKSKCDYLGYVVGLEIYFFGLNDLSERLELNYIMANVNPKEIHCQQLYNGGLFIKIFKFTDPHATPDGMFEGYEGVLTSLLISVRPDGDYYTGSKLYKIEGVFEPAVLEIKEASFPFFNLRVEYGFEDERKIEEFKLEGE